MRAQVTFTNRSHVAAADTRAPPLCRGTSRSNGAPWSSFAQSVAARSAARASDEARSLRRPASPWSRSWSFDTHFAGSAWHGGLGRARGGFRIIRRGGRRHALALSAGNLEGALGEILAARAARVRERRVRSKDAADAASTRIEGQAAAPCKVARAQILNSAARGILLVVEAAFLGEVGDDGRAVEVDEPVGARRTAAPVAPRPSSTPQRARATRPADPQRSHCAAAPPRRAVA